MVLQLFTVPDTGTGHGSAATIIPGPLRGDSDFFTIHGMAGARIGDITLASFMLDLILEDTVILMGAAGLVPQDIALSITAVHTGTEDIMGALMPAGTIMEGATATGRYNTAITFT